MWLPCTSRRVGRDLLLIDGFYAQFGEATAAREVSAIHEAAAALEQYPRINVLPSN